MTYELLVNYLKLERGLILLYLRETGRVPHFHPVSHLTFFLAGIIKGDEIMVINGAIVSDLDMMFIESVLQEEIALCMMMRSSRTGKTNSFASHSRRVRVSFAIFTFLGRLFSNQRGSTKALLAT